MEAVQDEGEGEGRVARVDASISLALSDEGPGTFIGDDLEVLGATGAGDVDGGRRPMPENDDPLFCLMAMCWVSLSQS